MTKLALVGIVAASLLPAADAPSEKGSEQVQVSHTDRMDFPSGGVLRMLKSTGDLTIEGWDQKDVEITTIKSTKTYHPGDRAAAAKKLDQIKLVTERKGDELTITTEFPKHPLPLRPFVGVSDYDLQYVIKVPKNARLVIEHDSGNIYIDDVTGDVRAKDGFGQITFHLPEQGQYAIDAKCDLGAINTDFPGPEHGKLVDRTLVSEPPAAGAQKLYARMGIGDIMIMKMNQPKAPEPLKP